MRVLLAICALAFGLGVAAPATAATPDFHLLGTPRLYLLPAGNQQGGPKIYVVFRSTVHLHEPRQVLASVKGHQGRTYASRRTHVANCYISTAIVRPAPIRPGIRYRVQFFVRPSAYSKTKTLVTSRKLVARSWAGFPPRRAELPSRVQRPLSSRHSREAGDPIERRRRRSGANRLFLAVSAALSARVRQLTP